MRDIVDFLVLDTLADDIESLEQIIPGVHRCVESWKVAEPVEHFDRSRIVSSLMRLVGENKVAVLQYSTSEKSLVDLGDRSIPDGSFDNLWFHMTPSGRIDHESWDPPAESVDLTVGISHVALIQWSDSQIKDGLPAVNEIVRPAWFEEEIESGPGWSLRCRFHVPPSLAGSPTSASIEFVSEAAPLQRLIPGAVLLMHEPGKREFARVSVVGQQPAV